MDTEHKMGLSSSEIASLWSTYMLDSLSISVLKYFLNNIKDAQIQSILEYAFTISQDQISWIRVIYEEENHPIPKGFTDEDVMLDAPRLYSDPYYLFYLKEMGRLGMANYTDALTTATRSDIIEFFNEKITSYVKLHNKTTHVLLEKGLYVKPPYIPMPEKIDFVKKESYLTGWFGDRRPLNVLQINELYLNILRNIHGRALLMGFAQTAQSKEVREWMFRGKQIADKIIEVYGSLLSEDDLPAPMTWDTEVTASTSSVFSDRLMMFHVQATNSIGMRDFGQAIGMAMRRDVATHHIRLSAETLKYAEDGLKIMINHGWLEEPPQMVNRDKLAE